jgi:nucleoside-diphosphate-sugar epimerase
VTGAAGRIGSAFFAQEQERYWFRLADRRLDAIPEADGHERLELEIADAGACRKACEGIDTVVHLAADPSPDADFMTSLLPNNIVGVYNIFKAAVDQGCKRVIFASSIHAVAGYPVDQQIHAGLPVRPFNMYGVSKCFGEATAAAFTEAFGLSTISIRIGAYQNDWVKDRATMFTLSAFLSPRDLNQLLVRCIEAPGITNLIVHGISNNRTKRMDLSVTKSILGYAPQDNGFELYELMPGE